jgi:hypothetical protein
MRFSRISVPKPLLIALVLISVASTAVAVAVVTQWPLDLRVKVGGTDFIVYELDGALTRLGEAHEYDFDVVEEFDPASWLIEIENLSPFSILVNYTVVDLPANFSIELKYDYTGFDSLSDWSEGDSLELQSAGDNQSVIVKITVLNQGAEAGSYSFQVIIQAV